MFCLTGQGTVGHGREAKALGTEAAASESTVGVRSVRGRIPLSTLSGPGFVQGSPIIKMGFSPQQKDQDGLPQVCLEVHFPGHCRLIQADTYLSHPSFPLFGQLCFEKVYLGSFLSKSRHC